MSDTAARFRRLAEDFTRTAQAVPDWSAPTPCPGWVARDVVGHLVDWMVPMFLLTWDREPPAGPPVAEDPASAWLALRDALQAALDDPGTAGAERETRAGTVTLEGMFSWAGLPDILVHRWDLARAAGLDDRLDPAEIAAMAAGLAETDPATDAAMRGSGHFGPWIEAPADADDQTRVLAFFGREG